MTDEDTKPALRKMGANERGAPSGYNLDVSGTVGPDHLGQETVDVDGDPNDRPGVRSRIPEKSGADHPEVSRMDTGEELPVLLSSDMQAGPVEGTQGSYTKIVEGHCSRCGYDRLRVSIATLPGEAKESCMACGAIQNHRAEGGYRMPKTDEQRANRERESGEKLGSLLTRGVYDLEETTGVGPYVSIVGDRSHLRLSKDDVSDLFWMLVENDDLDLEGEIRNRHTTIERWKMASEILPPKLEVKPSIELE